MRVSYILKNKEGILRPVVEADAEFIVKLRNQAHVRGCVNDTALDVEKQRQWIRDYLKRENEHYWIAETLDGRPYGTSSLYHYNAEKKQIETGRWVRMADAPMVNFFAGRIQMNDFVFNVLKMHRLVFDVVSTNKPVLKYHRLCGAVETGVEKNAAIAGDKQVDVIWFEETTESWKNIRPRICRLAGIPVDRPYGSIEEIFI